MVDNEKIGKRQKMNCALTDLNADCLLQIFKHLDFWDLLKLAEANLTDRSDNVFRPETNARTDPYQSSIRDAFSADRRLVHHNQLICSIDRHEFEFDEKVLRYFGSLISKVRLAYYPDQYRYSASIERVVLKNCQKTLVELNLCTPDQHAFDDINEPFSCVTTLSIADGCLSDCLSDFNKWFPTLESLTLGKTKIIDPGCLHKRFANLKRLTLHNRQPCRCSRDLWDNCGWDDTDLMFSVSNEDLKECIKMNPQLEYLNICHDDSSDDDEPDLCSIQINSKLLKFLNVKIPTLRNLHLNLRKSRLRYVPRNATINFENLMDLTVEADRIDQLHQLGRMMSDHLVNLSLCVRNPIDYQLLHEFVINRFKNIEFLCIECSPIDVRNQHFINMLKNLDHLQTLYIPLSGVDTVSFSEALFHCINEVSQIRVFKIRSTSFTTYETQHNETLNKVLESDLMKNKWKGKLDFMLSTFSPSYRFTFIFEKLSQTSL